MSCCAPLGDKRLVTIIGGPLDGMSFWMPHQLMAEDSFIVGPRSAPVDPTGGPTGEGREKVAGGTRRRKPAASDVVHLLGEFGRAACGARGGWLGLGQREVTCPECRGRSR